ncbi:MAG: helix-turn-helix domain-containing protein [Acidobacteria bacterium]|nr:helix-turn-helix domain-containing protein [Acidobacteriota bacterium]
MAHTIRWLTIRDAADRACCQTATIQRAVRSGRLRAARVDGREELRFLESWIDEWLIDQLLPEDRDIDIAIDAMPLAARGLR